MLSVTTRQRYHNATGTGQLTSPGGSQRKARVTYLPQWHDGVGRVIATADYGTKGSSTLTRPDTIPDRSDTVLVTTTEYNDPGDQQSVTNPAGVVTRFEYDAAGREVKRVMNYQAESSSSSAGSTSSDGDCPDSDDTNVAILTAYNADGNVSSITAVNPVTGNQTTQYIYGTTLADSEIATSTLKRAEIYPDSADDDDRITLKYNRQQEVIQLRDQQGTVHAFDYDGLGREVHDRITALGSGVDGAVRRISTSYEVRGMRAKTTSYDHPAVGSGSVVNEVEFRYNDFGQLVTEYQEHGGAVNTSTSPKVQYAYADGSGNTMRPTFLTYPDGRVLYYDYGPSGGVDHAASRIKSLIDSDGSTHLADYSYLGLGRSTLPRPFAGEGRGEGAYLPRPSAGEGWGEGAYLPLPFAGEGWGEGALANLSPHTWRGSTVAEVDYPEPDLKYTLVGTAGGNDPDTGDIYRGLDRFGRIKDSYWYDYGSQTDADRIKYGYDRNGNRLWRHQTCDPNSNYDELYMHDLIDRLKSLDRGQLDLTDPDNPVILSETFAQCWGLDATGNWRHFRQDDDGGGWDLIQERTANQVNEITDISETRGPSRITPLYNRAGNMTRVPKPSDPTQYYTCTYDAWNRLVKVEEGTDTVAEYEYDGAKRRTVEKTYSGGQLDETRHFFYTDPSRWQVIEERLEAGGSLSSDPDRQFIWGVRYVDDLVLRDRDSRGSGTLDERLYALQDANWNVTSIAGTDGTIQERYAYTAYGTPHILTPTFTPRANCSYNWQPLFAGYRFDDHVEFYPVRNRVFRPGVGWLQRDPIRHVQAPNLYEYCGANPVVRCDARGLLWETLKGWACDFLTGDCSGNALSCACFWIGAGDVVAHFFPPVVAKWFGIVDCVCDVLGILQKTCSCDWGPKLGIPGEIGSCLWNLLTQFDPDFKKIGEFLDALFDALFLALEEGLLEIFPAATSGFRACGKAAEACGLDELFSDLIDTLT